MQLFILQAAANLQLLAVRNKYFSPGVIFHDCPRIHFVHFPAYCLALVPNKIRILELKEKTLIKPRVASLTQQCEAGTCFS